MQQDLIAHPEPPERMAEFEVDRTPPAVAAQGVEVGATLLGRPPRLLLDPCAGDGVFAAEMLRRWPMTRCWAVEPRVEERARLLELCHRNRVQTSTFEAFADSFYGPPHFDLIATNPPFSIFPSILRRALGLLAPGGVVCLYCLSKTGHANEGERMLLDLFAEHPPVLQARVTRRVQHRYGINPKTRKKWSVDAQMYSFWYWQPNAPRALCVGPGVPEGLTRWVSVNLPELEPGAYKRRPPEEVPHGMGK